MPNDNTVPSGDPNDERLRLPGPPPKTTFGSAASPEGLRIAAYMAGVEPLIRPALDAITGPVAITLEVGVPMSADFLGANDLDNYLEPLCRHFDDRSRIEAVRATKRRGGDSFVRVERADARPPTSPGWSQATVAVTEMSPAAQREIARQLAPLATPLPWCEVELQFDIRCGPTRNWINLWKPAIDALVPLLGREPGKKEFDIADGRITSIALHRTLDPQAGNDIEITLRWRAAPETQAVTGRPLVYSLPTEPPENAAPSPSRPAPASVGHGIALIETQQEFRDAKTAGGFVLNRDSTGQKIHVAGCDHVTEDNFARKTLENGQKAYWYAAEIGAFGARWPNAKRCAVCRPG